MMTAAWPWFITVVLSLFLVSAWFASLVVLGDVAQVAPLVLLAVVLGGVFCLALMLRHRGAMIFLLCAAVILISITFRVRTPGDVGLDFQNGYKMAIWAIFILLYARNFNRTLRYYHDPVMLFFGGFCLCGAISSIYSPVPLVSLAGSIGTIAYLGFALVLAEFVGPRATLLSLLVSLLIYSMLNALSPLYAPEAAWFLTDPSTGIYRFMGITGQPNSLARQSAVFLILILCAYSRGYIGGRLALGLSIFAFALGMVTEGRTAMLSLLLALILQIRKGYLLLLALLCSIVVLVMWFSGLTDMIFAMVGRDGNADEAVTLAGRTELWSFVWDEITRQPLIGHGYSSFETYASEHYHIGADKGIVMITHNAYLDALFSTGVIGGIFFLSPFLILIWRWLTRPRFGRDLAVWAMMLVGMTEVEIPSTAILPPLMLFVLLAFDTRENFVNA
jgi:O-antigen ligase